MAVQSPVESLREGCREIVAEAIGHRSWARISPEWINYTADYLLAAGWAGLLRRVTGDAGLLWWDQKTPVLAACGSASNIIPPSAECLEELHGAIRKLEVTLSANANPMLLSQDAEEALQREIHEALNSYGIGGHPLGSRAKSEIASELSEQIIQYIQAIR